MILVFQLVVNKVGMDAVEKEILQEGNNLLLDNLEEGVIIVEENCKDVYFTNKSARNLMSSKKTASVVESADAEDVQLFSWDTNMLAPIPRDFFTDNFNVDTTVKRTQIMQMSDYLSVKAIVQAERDKNFPRTKQIFKVKPFDDR